MGSEMLFLGHNKQEKIMNNNKSNFTQTCNRFSQFLKERRSLGHLDAFKTTLASSEIEFKGVKELSGPKNTAINLFPRNLEKEKLSLELFPLMSSLTAAGVKDSTKTMADCRELSISENDEPKHTTTPSMTIFYGGRVLVFNELPEDKAREIMSLARCQTMRSSSHTQNQTETPTQTLRSINTLTSYLAQNVVPQGVSSLSDLPIARRVSLHRFMEKRKHRIAANAPYQLHNPSMKMADSHPHNMMTSLIEQQQLELKL